MRGQRLARQLGTPSFFCQSNSTGTNFSAADSMQGSARRVLSEHRVHRATLSSPGAAHRAPALSVPTTPRLVVGAREREAALGEAPAAAPAAASAPASGRKPLSHRRTLSQPVLLSDSSDDSGDGAVAARGPGPVQTHAAGPAGRGTAGPAAGSARKPGSVRRQVGRDKLRRAMQDDEDEDAGAAGSLVKQTAGALGAKIADEFGRALSAEAEAAAVAPRRASLSGRDAVPPAGPQKSPRRPREHHDVLRCRGTSLPVFRALCAQCYDVGGFLCAAPRQLSATTNLREFRGKIVLMQPEDLAYGARFSSAGACAFVVIAKDPEHAGSTSKCGRDIRVPVVYISDEGGKVLELGSLVKVLFDVASHSPQPATSKLSKNAHIRRSLNGTEGTAPANSEAAKPAPQQPLEDTEDSGTDSDDDAEFCLVRRRRQSRGATPASAKPNPSIEQIPARSAGVSHASSTVHEVVSDDDNSISARISWRRNVDRQLNKTPAARAACAPSEDTAAAVCESSSSRAVDTVVQEIMQADSSEILRRVAQLTDPSLADDVGSDRVVAALSTRFQQAVCSQEFQAKHDCVTRVRELCKGKSDSVAARVIDAFIHLPGSLDALWNILVGPTSGTDIESSPSWLPTQVAAAVCLRHVALDQKNVDLLLQCPGSVDILGRVMISGTNEDLRQKVAALIANLTVEQDVIREKMCKQSFVVRGLCQLLFTSNSKALDSSLAALSNISLDERQTSLIAKELNMVRTRLKGIEMLSCRQTIGRPAGSGIHVECPSLSQIFAHLALPAIA